MRPQAARFTPLATNEVYAFLQDEEKANSNPEQEYHSHSRNGILKDTNHVSTFFD
ncbi:MAG TPA: hypothetical protein VGN34_19720 [Ktedonobacteraceae bacterium]|jgi:hypothetical protein